MKILKHVCGWKREYLEKLAGLVKQSEHPPQARADTLWTGEKDMFRWVTCLYIYICKCQTRNPITPGLPSACNAHLQ